MQSLLYIYICTESFEDNQTMEVTEISNVSVLIFTSVSPVLCVIQINGFLCQHEGSSGIPLQRKENQYPFYLSL